MMRMIFKDANDGGVVWSPFFDAPCRSERSEESPPSLAQGGWVDALPFLRSKPLPSLRGN